MSGDGNLFFASIGVNPGKSTTICDVAGLDFGIVIVNSCELYYQKPDKYQEHQKIGKIRSGFCLFYSFLLSKQRLLIYNFGLFEDIIRCECQK